MQSQKGMSLIEVLIALLLSSIVVLAAVTFISTSFTNTTRNKDKDFATQKAIAMLEELKAILEDQKNDASLLDAYDDGPLKVYPESESADLTIRDVVSPLDPPSGNIAWAAPKTDTDFKYVRHISVQRLPGAQSGSIRLVNVKIFLNDDVDRDGKPDLLAEVAGVLQTVASNFPPTQVYDVYLLALENVPGWWVYMNNLIPFVQNAMADLQARNPGLEFRAHWITKLSYGRDQEYTPYLNNAASSTAASSGNLVYWYPGSMPNTAAVPFYYPPAGFNAHINVDGVSTNGLSALNTLPYALADQFNNGMRYPDELAYFERRVQAGLEREDTPTFRILLERMATKPADFQNAIFINLHGELFPFPPIRNYSDPAKEPVDFANVRVVTHPERLRYRNDDELKIRVYGYRINPPNDEDNPLNGNGAVPAPVDGVDILQNTPITITIKGLTGDWNPAGVAGNQIQAIKGGFDFEAPVNVRDPYTLITANTIPSANGMYYTVDNAGSNTVISLFNTPLRTPAWSVTGQDATCTAAASPGTTCWKGLRTGKRLYGMEYIPSPLEDFTLDTTATPVAGTTTPIPTPTPFTKNLSLPQSTTAGAVCTSGDCAKNTARWILTIPQDLLPENNMVTIETRIGDDGCSGLLYPPDPLDPDVGTCTAPNQPTNLSRTFTWRGDDDHIFGNPAAVGGPIDPILPYTERYQILGDPRHLPYVDSKQPHSSPDFVLRNEDSLGMGYNRYFDDFQTDAIKKTSGIGNLSAAANDLWPGWTYIINIGGNNTLFGVKSNGNGTDDGWNTSAGFLEIDEHRIFQTYRAILMKVNSVYTTMSGFSYYYTGIGNEIGYDTANGFPNSIPVDLKPFNGVAGAGFENSITGSVKYIREGSTVAGYWWGINWLGELYPDGMYPSTVPNGWVNTGNLPTGNAANSFVRVNRSGIANAGGGSKFPYPDGTNLITANRRPQAQGSTTFFWIGTPTSTFHHEYLDNTTGTLLAAGTDIGTSYSYPIPDNVPLYRPFSTTYNQTGYNPDHFLQTVYSPILTATPELQFYSHAGAANQGSSLLALNNAANDDVAFVVVNGLSMTTASGTAFISRWSMLTLIQSFLRGGLYGITGSDPGPKHIQQLSRVQITQPSDTMDLQLLNDPDNLELQWKAEWKRWNGKKYIEGAPPVGYPDDFAEDTSDITFFVMYNNNELDALSWKYMQDDSTATPGVRAPAALGIAAPLPLKDPTDPNDPYTYDWNLSDKAKFGQGNYIVRVEAYRDGLPLHYSYHQYRVFIRR
jgi:prepilin-type N-terminal cleavage/methylation domain-containing protein